MIKACIFDMDGTTVNTINSISHFANSALKKYNLPVIETEKYKYLVGDGARVLVQRMIETVGGSDSDFEKVLSEYNTTYDNDFMYLTEAYDGILDLLDSLKERGIKSAILSNKPHETAIKVSDVLFGDKINICHGARASVPLKPDPSGVFELLDLLGLKKEECLYIGDTATDMKTGKSSGLYTVGVLWGFRKRDELAKNGADVIISQPCELLDVIDKFN